MSPIKHLALLAITHRENRDRAWLVNLDTKERHILLVGESLEGLTLREVQPESVLLTGGDEEYELHLGEKPIPTDAVETIALTSPFDTPAPGSPRGGQRAWRAMARAARGSNAGQRWSGRRTGGGNGGRNAGRNGGGRPRLSFNGGNRNAPRVNFRGGQAGFRGFVGTQGGRTSTSALKPTSNPQQARRQGVRLLGGSKALPEPPPIQNPQTLRRLGTTGGNAFGQNNSGRTNGTGQRAGSNQRSQQRQGR